MSALLKAQVEMSEVLDLLSVHGKIIEEDLHERWNIFLENFGNDALESGRCHFQAEHHYECNEHTPFGHESRLLLVIRVHPDLIVATKPI